jgi:hypothetical protein
MPQPLCTGTILQCSMGVAPSVFVALPLPGTPMILGGMPAATILQTTPVVNILPFGLCRSPANPAVASATAAAMGALTPMPCTPLIPTTWAPPSLTTFHGMLPVASSISTCACMFGGVISVSVPVPGPVQFL